MPILKIPAPAPAVSSIMPLSAHLSSQQAAAIIGAQSPAVAGGSQGGSSGGSGLGSMTSSISQIARQASGQLPTPAQLVASPVGNAAVAASQQSTLSKAIGLIAKQAAGLLPTPAQLVASPTGNAAAQAYMQNLQGSGGSLDTSGPTQGRRQNLGFPQTTINILATTNIVSAPQVYFRPDRLFIASATGASFNVANIEVGNKQQLVNSNPCPAAMFSELAVNADVEYDTCAPAVSITVQITSVNTSASVASTPGMTGRSAY